MKLSNLLGLSYTCIASYFKTVSMETLTLMYMVYRASKEYNTVIYLIL